MIRLFMDASSWVPMAVPRDQAAGRLREIFAMLGDEPIEYVTTTWTLYEALAMARRRNWEASTMLYGHVRQSTDIVRIDDVTEAEALRRFLTWRDKSASVVDHANALVAAARHCDAILSFDQDFVPLAAASGLRILR